MGEGWGRWQCVVHSNIGNTPEGLGGAAPGVMAATEVVPPATTPAGPGDTGRLPQESPRP